MRVRGFVPMVKKGKTKDAEILKGVFPNNAFKMIFPRLKVKNTVRPLLLSELFHCIEIVVTGWSYIIQDNKPSRIAFTLSFSLRLIMLLLLHLKCMYMKDQLITANKLYRLMHSCNSFQLIVATVATCKINRLYISYISIS